MNEAHQEKRRTELLEDLARLEHEQWKSWAYNIIDTENLSKERTSRWLAIGKKEWHELSDLEKHKDLEWAERVLWIIKKHMGIK